jgi:hypothetical protein
MEEIVKKSVTAEVKETCAMLTEEEHMLLKLLEKKQRITSYRGKKNVTGYASNSSPKVTLLFMLTQLKVLMIHMLLLPYLPLG